VVEESSTISRDETQDGLNGSSLFQPLLLDDILHSSAYDEPTTIHSCDAQQMNTQESKTVKTPSHQVLLSPAIIRARKDIWGSGQAGEDSSESELSDPPTSSPPCARNSKISKVRDGSKISRNHRKNGSRNALRSSIQFKSDTGVKRRSRSSQSDPDEEIDHHKVLFPTFNLNVSSAQLICYYRPTLPPIGPKSPRNVESRVRLKPLRREIV
jgi:hypothetical protein